MQNRWLILAIVSTALFLIGIDMTVLYTALPRLTHDLGASASQKLWIINTFPLVMASLLPGFGTLGDRVGHRRIFCIGLVLFAAASLFAAFAPSANALIVGRGLLAVGAALMMPATLALIRLAFSNEKERALALGIWGAVFSGAAAIGPVIGGVLLTYFWWGSVFLINVPVVLLALLLTAVFLRPSPGNPHRRWDLTGSLLIMVGLVGIVYALKEIVRPDRNFVHFTIAALIGGLFTGVFVWAQHRSKSPVIDFRLFRIIGLRVGIVTAFASSVSLMGVQLAFSQQLQLVKGLTPLQAALAMVPISVSAFLAGPLAGFAMPRLGMEGTITIGLLLSGFGLSGLAVVGEGTGVLPLLLMILFGFGSGCAMAAASAAIMMNSPEDRAGMAASMEGVTYEIGGTLGVAVLGSMLTAVYAANLIVPAGLNVPASVRDSIDQALIVAEGLQGSFSAHLKELARHAFDKAFIVVLWIGAAIQILTTAYVAYNSTSATDAVPRSD